ncbi:hypothetical protein D3C86_1842370 [compost metagenome]
MDSLTNGLGVLKKGGVTTFGVMVSSTASESSLTPSGVSMAIGLAGFGVILTSDISS